MAGVGRVSLAIAGYDPTRPVPTFEKVRTYKPRLKQRLPVCTVCIMHAVTRPQHQTCSTTCAGVLRRRNRAKRARERFRKAHANKWLTFPLKEDFDV